VVTGSNPVAPTIFSSHAVGAFFPNLLQFPNALACVQFSAPHCGSSL